ncbi:MAG TPA: hypothetical protein VFY65_03560 [Longimicrobium sp.]|nr:hypothetical protein [Longimicrobium sp.]
MPLLPYDKLLIDSPLPMEQARARLERITGPRTWLRTWGMLSVPSHPFVGEVTGDQVRIQRAIVYQNSFLPHIEARLEPRPEGCRLAGSMSLHPLVGVFMLFWVAMAAVIALSAAVGGLRRGELDAGWWMPLGMLVFAWVLCSGAFTIEAGIARNRLAALLEGVVPER